MTFHSVVDVVISGQESLQLGNSKSLRYFYSVYDIFVNNQKMVPNEPKLFKNWLEISKKSLKWTNRDQKLTKTNQIGKKWKPIMSKNGLIQSKTNQKFAKIDP